MCAVEWDGGGRAQCRWLVWEGENHGPRGDVEGGARWSDKHVGPFKCCVYGFAIYVELGGGWAGVFVSHLRKRNTLSFTILAGWEMRIFDVDVVTSTRNPEAC